jgi:parallel beta-helix repeat protein
MGAGDTLYVRAGTYAEAIDSTLITLPTGTSWSNAPRIAAYGSDKVTLTRGGKSVVLNFQNPYVKYIIFDGFVIDASGAENGIKIQNRAHHVRIQDCEVKNSSGQGILMTGGTATHHNEILGCNIHDNGKDRNLDHGLYIAASDNRVEDCNVHHNLAFGIHVYDGRTAAAHRNIIRDNKSHHNGTTGILIGSGADNVASYNTVYSNGKNGIQVGYKATNNKVSNNRVYDNGEGIQIRRTSSGTRVSNNTLYSNTVNIRNLGSSTTLLSNILD